MPASNDGSRGDSTTANRPPSDKPAEEWKLENSSLWWLSLDLFQNPGNVLLMTSVPFCMGAYYGYLQPPEKLEEWVGDAPTENKSSSPGSTTSSTTNRVARRALERETEILAARQMGLQIASRAFGLATLGTVGSFGLLGAVGFYLSGYKSVNEAMMATRQWASGRTQSFEDWMGLDERESKTHPEVIATKNMTEEEEVNYVYDRLVKEIETEENNSRKG